MATRWRPGLGILLLHDFEGKWLVPRISVPNAMGPMAILVAFGRATVFEGR